MTERPTLNGLHDRFISQTEAYEECPDYPVHTRWTHILMTFPEVARLKLHGDLNHIYKRALDNPSTIVTGCAFNLAQLQQRWLHVLNVNGMLLPHIHKIQAAQLELWQYKLLGRAASIKPARRKKGEIVPQQLEAYDPPILLN